MLFSCILLFLFLTSKLLFVVPYDKRYRLKGLRIKQAVLFIFKKQNVDLIKNSNNQNSIRGCKFYSLTEMKTDTKYYVSKGAP